MDIFNRGPSIAEDTVQFNIYPPPELSDKAAVATFAACITDYVKTLLPNFLWHRDAFEVNLVPHPMNSQQWILEGRMRVGDCIDDEWATVWLLKEATAKWDVAVSIFDSDGEFLLIEAADVLPTWVQPDNSENRVWIYKSRLHLIPLTFTSAPSKRKFRRKLPNQGDSDDEGIGAGDEEDFIAVDDALKFLRDPSTHTLAPEKVEQIVWSRISGYPTAARNHIHVTKAYIPADVARSLSANPSLVQKAVETFYTRDAIQLRAAHKMLRFPPSTSVLVPVKVTRTAYAQLLGQKFYPPKIFGQWKEAEGTREWRWRDVGMKIAVGFEMLYQESKNRNSAQTATADTLEVRAQAQKEALQRDPEYQKYIQNLTSSQYFRGEIQGSELWNKFENQAAQTFVDIRRADDATRPSFSYQVDSALATARNVPDYADVEEDSDEWLTVDAQDLDRMLEDSMSGNKQPKAQDAKMESDDQLEDRIASEQAKKLKDLASKVEDFVEGQGDLQGALFEDEQFSDEEFSGGEDSGQSEDDSDEGNEGVGKQTDVERQAAMAKLVPALDPSDYGKMPASFSKSQTTAPITITTDVIGDTPSRDDMQQPSATPGKSKEKPIRPPIIPRDKYDGVDSDDESDVEDDEESDEERPQVVGEIEIDMGEEEEEFLEFSRQQLGITDEQWNEIVQDRKDRGAFLPASATKKSKTSPKLPGSKTTPAQTQPQSQQAAKAHSPREPEAGPRPNVNPELDSFEAVMKALEEELGKIKNLPQSDKKFKGKGKEKAKDPVDDEQDIEQDIDAAMDAELKQALEGGNDSDEEQPMDYNLIKNFLESFKSQAGLAGPVGNLAGRVKPDLKLPRDES